ncbi:MAG: C10 family peptidase [Bacteroidales bacterium]|nr:C10 family peptidase [Bacteroidales bacterium]MDD4217878.1 C10 family peptidase [Bacteroidales bacterium]MDY0141732.1 C10 family peptidase [Bacteroidales bacterium]
MRKLFLFTIVSFLSIVVFADFVPRKNAEKVAKSYYYQSVSNVKSQSWGDITLNCIYDPVQNPDFNYYVFNINGDEGFVIIPSDDKIQPILAYSFEGGFNNNNMAPAQQEMLNYYNDCIQFASENQMTPEVKAVNQWAELINYDYKNGIKQKTTSPILLENINWNQTWPYNAQCPADADGINGHVPVGCVATAMLHVMKYYNWPPSGEGTKYHSSMANGGYGNMSINFASHTYDWSAMPNEASSYVNEELGKINFHAGIAVSMYWGPTGSGSQTTNISTALKSYFKYSLATKYVKRYNYSETNWKNLIKAQVDAGMPMVYSGSSTTTGHAWNCDGYDANDKFHMNWGWGGYGNGYFTLDNLTTTGTSGGPEDNFNQYQEMVINIYPRDTYPIYCNDTRIITGKEGSFGDGSANENYQNNQSCVYVIDPLCGDVISLSFNDFDLGTGDQLTLFDGDETSSIVIATFDADNLPRNNTYSTGLGVLTIRFDTDASSTGEGWNVDYSVKNCKTGNVLTTSSGSFTDGSGVCEYDNSSVCTWNIEPENVNWITLTFDEFELAGNIDYVKIFKTNVSSSNTVVSFNANNPPTAPIAINDSVVIVQFFTDSDLTADGWKVSYTSSLSDVEENKLLSNFSVMPNPGNLNSRLEFSITDKSETTIMVTNLLGEVIAVKEFNLMAGLHNFALSEIINSKLNAGVYTINVNANNQTKTQKLVVVE